MCRDMWLGISIVTRRMFSNVHGSAVVLTRINNYMNQHSMVARYHHDQHQHSTQIFLRAEAHRTPDQYAQQVGVRGAKDLAASIAQGPLC